MCKIECIPQSGSFELDVPVNRATTSHAAEFTRALAARPREIAGVSAEARVDAGALAFTLQGLPASLRGHNATWFPEIAGVVDNPAPVEQNWNGATLQARWPISAQRSESPATFPLVLAFDDGSNLRVVAAVRTDWTVASVSAATSAAPGVAVPACGVQR